LYLLHFVKFLNEHGMVWYDMALNGLLCAGVSLRNHSFRDFLNCQQTQVLFLHVVMPATHKPFPRNLCLRL